MLIAILECWNVKISEFQICRRSDLERGDLDTNSSNFQLEKIIAPSELFMDRFKPIGLDP